MCDNCRVALFSLGCATCDKVISSLSFPLPGTGALQSARLDLARGSTTLGERRCWIPTVLQPRLSLARRFQERRERPFLLSARVCLSLARRTCPNQSPRLARTTRCAVPRLSASPARHRCFCNTSRQCGCQWCHQTQLASQTLSAERCRARKNQKAS